MSTIQEYYGLRQVQPVIPAGLAKYDLPNVRITSPELIGIEVEVENFQRTEVVPNRAWQVTTDGSLRNNGYEVVSKPFPASYAVQMLNYLFTAYLNNDCCWSPRTSIHVHLNVQDLTREQVQDLILIYSIYERLFYKFAGAGRQKNIYCVPLFDCDLLVNMVDYGETRDRNWSKYTGFNSLPIHEYGTVEFRHMHGTTNVSKLAAWINLICKLKEYVKRTSTASIRKMISEMNDSFDFGGLMNEVFGEHASAFVYEGPAEMCYEQAKQALTPRANARNVMLSTNQSTAFFKFKGN